jgi:hypothetical protein
MNEGIDRDRMLMLHVIRFGDPEFFEEVIGPGPYYVMMPRMNGKILFRDMMTEYYKKIKRRK